MKMKRCPHAGSGEAEPGSVPLGIKGWERDNHRCRMRAGDGRAAQTHAWPSALRYPHGCREKNISVSIGGKKLSPEGAQGGGP